MGSSKQMAPVPETELDLEVERRSRFFEAFILRLKPA